jgi:PhnB protein
METKLVAYLYFDKKCREAMEFYQTCLGGDLKITAVKDTPAAAQFPAEYGDLVMHAELTRGPLSLMASDALGDPVKPGNQITLMLNCSSEKELQDAFTALARGGNVDTPVRKEFWGAVFGQVTDRFGIQWMFNYGQS